MQTDRRILALASILVLIFVSLNAASEGAIKHYQVQEGTGFSTKALSVYLPEDYSKSEATYPVLYLIHGYGGNNLTFLGSGYKGEMSDANVSLIADNLIQQKRISPFIVVCPDLSAVGLYDDYLIRVVVPFVDSTLRTIPNRNSRAIAGHSLGGLCSLYQALAHPEVFSIVGSFSCLMDMYKIQTIEGLLKEHNKISNPIRFWIYEGRKDVNRFGEGELVKVLKEDGLPTIYVEDDGDHINKVARRLGEFLEYISEFLKR